MKLVYFAWIRERIGRSEEEIDLPADVRTAGDLLRWLRGRGDGYEHALGHPQAIRVAADRQHVGHDEPITDAREVALFPPMTGG